MGRRADALEGWAGAEVLERLVAFRGGTVGLGCNHGCRMEQAGQATAANR